MKILFIISGSIAAKKSLNVLNILEKKRVYINCIVTENAKKMIKLKDLIELSEQGRRSNNEDAIRSF